jgi:hypothetical protein
VGDGGAAAEVKSWWAPAEPLPEPAPTAVRAEAPAAPEVKSWWAPAEPEPQPAVEDKDATREWRLAEEAPAKTALPPLPKSFSSAVAPPVPAPPPPAPPRQAAPATAAQPRVVASHAERARLVEAETTAHRVRSGLALLAVAVAVGAVVAAMIVMAIALVGFALQRAVG